MVFTLLGKRSMTILQIGAFLPAVMAVSSYNQSYVSTMNFTSGDILSNNGTNINPLDLIEEANRRFTRTLIPCTVYIGVLIVIGFIGNSLVFYVFGFRLKRSPQNFFILLLGVLDLLSCTIGLPAEITDVTLHFKFDSPTLCKTMRFVNGFAAMASICTLIVIAVDRYRRVRKPLQPQITLRQAHLCLVPIMGVTLVLSTPAIYVYGLRTIETGFPGVHGLDCTISDEAKVTIVPLVYNGVLFICFIILAVSLIVMYSMILRSLKEHAKMFRKLSTCTTSTVMESLSSNEVFTSNEESVSSAHMSDCENVRKQSNPTQSPSSAESAGDVFPAGEFNGGDEGSNNAFSCKDGSNSSSMCNHSQTLQGNDSAHMAPCDCPQEDLTEPKQISLWIPNPSYVADTDAVDHKIKKAIETCDPTVSAAESDLREDKNNTADHESNNTNKIKDISSGNEETTPNMPSVGRHVSFDAGCVGATSTDLPDLKTWSRAVPYLGSTAKRKLSEMSLLKHLDKQSQKYIDQIIKLHKGKECPENHANQRRDSLKEKTQESETPKQRQLTRKTTIIAFVVTLVFIISFVPHLCLQVAHLIRKGFDEKLDGAPLALYNIFLRSYFINSVANPIIYGLMNEKFRAEVKLLATRLSCCKRKP
ncbi:hypothetical protein BsWGS_17650 [Bradybaena similaris]